MRIFVPVFFGLTSVAGWAAERPLVSAAATAPMSAVTRIMHEITDGRAEAALRDIADHEKELSEFDRQDLSGRACLVLKRYPQAISAFTAALKLEPSSADTRYLLGRAYAATSDDVPAIAAFEKAEFHGLDTPDLHMALARVYQRRGRILGDLQTRAGLKADPGTIVSGAFVAVRASPPPAAGCVVAPRNTALYHAVRAARQDPDSGEMQLLLADVWAAAAIHDQACKTYAKACSRLPVALRGACLQHWSDSLLAMRDFDGYFARLREWMMLPGGLSAHDLADRYARAADAMRDAGDVARQVRYLTFAVEVEPKSAARHLALAEALGWAGRFTDAAEHWRETLRLQPDHPRADEIRRLLKDIDEAKPDP